MAEKLNVLLCDYSDSSASDSDVEMENTINKGSNAMSIPSADDLFTNPPAQISSSHAVSSSKSTIKRHLDDNNDNNDNKQVHDKKKQRITGQFKPNVVPPSKPQIFLPPQLKRPNISTEDLAAWNTEHTMQKHRLKLQMKRK